MKFAAQQQFQNFVSRRASKQLALDTNRSVSSNRHNPKRKRQNAEVELTHFIFKLTEEQIKSWVVQL
jgi:hypothetical protein